MKRSGVSYRRRGIFAHFAIIMRNQEATNFLCPHLCPSPSSLPVSLAFFYFRFEMARLERKKEKKNEQGTPLRNFLSYATRARARSWFPNRRKYVGSKSTFLSLALGYTCAQHLSSVFSHRRVVEIARSRSSRNDRETRGWSIRSVKSSRVEFKSIVAEQARSRESASRVVSLFLASLAVGSARYPF